MLLRVAGTEVQIGPNTTVRSLQQLLATSDDERQHIALVIAGRRLGPDDVIFDHVPVRRRRRGIFITTEPSTAPPSSPWPTEAAAAAAPMAMVASAALLHSLSLRARQPLLRRREGAPPRAWSRRGRRQYRSDGLTPEAIMRGLAEQLAR